MQTFLRFLVGRQVLSVSLSHSVDTAMPVLELLLRGAFPGHDIAVEKRSGTDIRGQWSQVRYEILLPCPLRPLAFPLFRRVLPARMLQTSGQFFQHHLAPRSISIAKGQPNAGV